MNNIIIFDLEICGHHSEYISHLVDYLYENKPIDNYLFVVNPNFKVQFPEIFEKIKFCQNVSIYQISIEEYHKLNKMNILLRSIASYRLMNALAKQYKVQQVLLLYFNIFQLALAIFRPTYKLSGILFLQYSRMELNSLEEKLKYFRKFLQTWLYVKNSSIKRIFVLNDQRSVEYLNKRFKTSIFQMLPDPVPELTALPNFSIRKTYNIPQNRKIILHAGAISERKGTLDILDAYNEFSKMIVKNISFIIIGKADEKINNLIIKKLEKIREKDNQSQIIYKNEFVSSSILKSFFDQCDAVIVPYKNIEASSGIIGHAIAAGKPIIGTNKGLLGELICENDGILLEESNPIQIAKGIATFLKRKTSNINNSTYLAEHSKETFSSHIFSSVNSKFNI